MIFLSPQTWPSEKAALNTTALLLPLRQTDSYMNSLSARLCKPQNLDAPMRCCQVTILIDR
jgi:hypothetical protein